MKKALIVDDEPLLRRQVREALASFGFDQFVEAENGQQAVELARSEKPLLIVMDVSMPIKDGVSAATEINRETPLPIVLLTATTDSETVARAREAGVSNYLLKPFREEQLAVVVDLAIDQYIRMSNLKDEVDKLKETLETRKQVERAKGVLIKQGMSEPEAYRKMQKLAMDKRKSLREVAEAILLMED